MLAAILLLVGAATPLLLREDVEENRTIKAAFERTAAYAADYEARSGQLPDRDRLRAWTDGQGFGWFSSSISLDPIGCGQEGFYKEDGDSFVVGVWRGEWFDCFAFPSGKTTLKTSQAAFLLGGIGINIGTLLLIGCFLAWLSWRMGRSAHSMSLRTRAKGS